VTLVDCKVRSRTKSECPPHGEEAFSFSAFPAALDNQRLGERCCSLADWLVVSFNRT